MEEQAENTGYPPSRTPVFSRLWEGCNVLILSGPGAQPPRRLTQALQKWMDCAEKAETYFTYELRCEKVPRQTDEPAVSALLDAVMEQAMELCSQSPPQERWLSLLFDCAPEGLQIECAGPGPLRPIPQTAPGGVPMVLSQGDGDFHLRLKMDLELSEDR